MLRVRPRLSPLTLCFAALSLVGSARAAPATDDAARELGRIRAALDAGDVEGAARLLKSAKTERPGLVGEVLRRQGDGPGACGAYGQDAASQTGARKAAAALRHARCLADEGDSPTAGWLEVLSSTTLGRDVMVADEAAAALLAENMADKAAAALAPWLLGAPIDDDTTRREAHARLLRVLAEHGDKAHTEKALELLYTELAETEATKAALKLPAAKKLAAHKDRKLALARADVLTARHGNDELLETLSRHRPKAGDTSSTACRIRFLIGKAERKRRHYKSSRQNLDFVADKCAEPWRKKARYLAARVASYAGNADALALLDAFIAEYSGDELTDDVILWKAEYHAGVGALDKAERAYAQIVDGYSTGDMIHVARFDRAFLLARRGDVAGARAELDLIARQGARAPVIIVDQALYWRARLGALPKLESTEPTSDAAALDEAIGDLVALATSRPASFYGHLAGLVALDLAARRPELAPRTQSLTRPSLHVDAARIYDDAAARVFGAAHSGVVASAVELIGAGYGEEAALLLDGVAPAKKTDAELRAALYLLAGRADKSHQVMRNAGFALPAGLPSGASTTPWLYAFPFAHRAAIEAGARGAELPPAMLFGLAREESAFDAAVVSWAGAIGLCQLMPFTAREEAERARINPNPELAALRTPELNAKLGGNHLGRRWKQLHHPLLAIAAYNAGPGNVDKWRKKVGEVPLDTFVELIPVEQTRNYVKKVTGSWVVYTLLQNGEPVRYDLTLPPR